jgi:hypothetical protein
LLRLPIVLDQKILFVEPGQRSSYIGNLGIHMNQR